MPDDNWPEHPEAHGDDAANIAAGSAAERAEAWDALAASAPVDPDAAAEKAQRTHSGHHRKHHSRRAKKRRRLIWAGIGALLLVVLIAGAVTSALFVREVSHVKASLANAQAGLTTLSAAVKAGDEAKIQSTAADLTANVSAAADTVDGPLWNVAARVPVVGANVDAVQRVTRAVDILTQRAMTPGLQVMSTLKTDQIVLKKGGVDLGPFQKAQASLPAITAAFQQAQQQVAPIDEAALMSFVAGPVGQVVEVIDSATPQLEFAQKYLPTLLDVAGAKDKQTYLLIFQNNAEIRATGGNAAASMIVTMDKGRLAEAGQANSGTFAPGTIGEQQFAKLPASTTKLYLPGFSRHSQDFTMSPDFPTTATLFENVFKSTSGQKFDGVISVDPVVLSHMLAVTGPVKLSDGQTITSANAVKMLLHDAYLKYPTGAESDAFFADTAKTVFTHLMSSKWDATRMLDALTTSAAEQRVYLNFNDKKAQALAAELGVDGALASPSAKPRTTVGMYLNDSSVGKLEYYLTSTVDARCDVDERTLTETMTLRNSAPKDLTGGYILGERNANHGIPRTTMMLDVVSFAPPGAKIVVTDPKKGRVAEWERTGTEKGNSAVSHTVYVPAGETVTVSYTVKLPSGDLAPLQLRHSPTANDTAVAMTPSCTKLFGGTNG